MAITTISDDIYKDVFFELLSIVNGKLNYFINQLRFISINMYNWRLDGFGYVGAIQSCSGLGRSSGKANLIIGYYMNNSVDIVVV